MDLSKEYFKKAVDHFAHNSDLYNYVLLEVDDNCRILIDQVIVGNARAEKLIQKEFNKSQKDTLYSMFVGLFLTGVAIGNAMVVLEDIDEMDDGK